MEKVIVKVENNSIAKIAGIKPGDVLLSVNEKTITDVFDYRYMIQETKIKLETIKPDGEKQTYSIEKDEYADLGLIFETGLMDNAKSCTNKCIFCFIDQLPLGMRNTLYFKDDDSRLSFLSGNYVTLTNMKLEDLDRITYYHLSPINISLHTTDPKLRLFMLKNPEAVNIMNYLEILYNANIVMNFQVVLCKGINDLEALDKTIDDLSRYIPKAHSLSVVPAGLTKYRENLFQLENFNKSDATNLIRQVERWQDTFLSKYNTRFIYASDEFYLKARQKLPKHADYEDFPQIENGVGMLSLFRYEFLYALKKVELNHTEPRTITIITGTAAYNTLSGLIRKFTDKYKAIRIKVIPITNSFFGGEITVSGLLTGGDIITALSGIELGEFVLIPKNALRANETVFLDDLTIEDLAQKLNTKVLSVNTSGKSLVNALLFGID